MSKTVLVVDDEEFIRELVAVVLERNETPCDLVSSGFDAIAAFAAAPQRYSAVLLDVHMRGMNGFDTFAELRRIDPSVPIILMTGKEPAELTTLGADAVLQKPFNFDQLLAVIAKVARSDGKTHRLAVSQAVP